MSEHNPVCVVAAVIDHGVELENSGRPEEAIARYREAIARDPVAKSLCFRLGNVLMRQGRFSEAAASYSQELRVDPGSAEAAHNLGTALENLGKHSQAIVCYQKAITLNPSYAEAYNNLGVTHAHAGHLEEAIANYRQALALNPSYADAWSNLGSAMEQRFDYASAIEHCKRAMAFQPNHAGAHLHLGNTYKYLGRFNEAAAMYQKAASLSPHKGGIYSNLAETFKDQGKLQQAEESFQKAIAARPIYRPAYSNLLYFYAFTRHVSAAEERIVAQGWEKHLLTDVERSAARHRANPQSGIFRPTRTGRKLRVGIVVAELGYPGVEDFLEPFLEELDRSRFHLTIFPSYLNSRALRFKDFADRHGDGFVPLPRIPPAQAAELIRSHQIDILIETTGHLYQNSLEVVAHRAAPVQCSYIGYWSTTGLTEMDWFITGNGMGSFLDAHFKEKIWRLPRVAFCYKGDPTLEHRQWEPDPEGTIWLGSFNNNAKIREDTLALWAKVLHALPEAKLLFEDRQLQDEETHQRLGSILLRLGIEESRFEFIPQVPKIHTGFGSHERHMSLFPRLDIALDTIPFNSVTTAYDSLWMGVPLVTIAGTTMGGNQAGPIVTALGHPEWVAKNDEEYVSIVCSLARDLGQRKALRETQRARMAASELCDAKGLARCLESAFEDMFDRWTEGVHQAPSAFPLGEHFHQGNALMEQGRFSEAIQYYSQELRENPESYQVVANLGSALRKLGRYEQAITCYQKAISLQMAHPERPHSLWITTNNLGLTYYELRRYEDAIASYRKAILHHPDFVDPYVNMSNPLMARGEVEEAAEICQRAVEIEPGNTNAHLNLGNAYRQLGQFDAAAESFQRAASLTSNNGPAYNNLGMLFRDWGKLKQAAEFFEKAVTARPLCAPAYSNLLYFYAFTRYVTPAEERRVAEAWETLFLTDQERALARKKSRAGGETFPVRPRVGRKLRIGIITAEWFPHPVAQFLEPLLEQINRSRFALTVFPTLFAVGPRVQRFRDFAQRHRDGFIPLWRMGAAEAAECIRAEQIDVLVETTGHTNGNRLDIIAHRAAPVQCSYLGYWSTTGLTEMDWFITGTGVGAELEPHFTERLWRLPRLAHSYLGDALIPEYGWAPDPNGTVWVGCLTNNAKIREESLALWAKVLHALPEAKLLLEDARGQSEETHQRVLGILNRLGIDESRCSFIPYLPGHERHMLHYHRLDVVLDTIPFNSGTTGYDALWMGAPIVTLEGNWMGGTMAASVLKAFGRPEWIAHSEEEYVSIVCSLARDVEKRKQLRQTQRARMAASELCDGKGLARVFEEAFEAMHDRWSGDASAAHGADRTADATTVTAVKMFK
jgi:protein O-GlcNAc transferase